MSRNATSKPISIKGKTRTNENSQEDFGSRNNGWNLSSSLAKLASSFDKKFNRKCKPYSSSYKEKEQLSCYIDIMEKPSVLSQTRRSSTTDLFTSSPTSSFASSQSPKRYYIHSISSQDDCLQSPPNSPLSGRFNTQKIAEKVLSEDDIDLLNSNSFDDIIKFGYRHQCLCQNRCKCPTRNQAHYPQARERRYTEDNLLYRPTISISLTPPKLNNNYGRKSQVCPFN